MSQETETQIREIYGEKVESTIRGWFEPELKELDHRMNETYINNPQAFKVYEHSKKTVLERVHTLTTRVIIVFAGIIENLESSGYAILKDRFLGEQIEAYLQRMGIRAGYLEGASLFVGEETLI